MLMHQAVAEHLSPLTDDDDDDDDSHGQAQSFYTLNQFIPNVQIYFHSTMYAKDFLVFTFNCRSLPKNFDKYAMYS